MAEELSNLLLRVLEGAEPGNANARLLARMAAEVSRYVIGIVFDPDNETFDQDTVDQQLVLRCRSLGYKIASLVKQWSKKRLSSRRLGEECEELQDELEDICHSELSEHEADASDLLRYLVWGLALAGEYSEYDLGEICYRYFAVDITGDFDGSDVISAPDIVSETAKTEQEIHELITPMLTEFQP